MLTFRKAGTIEWAPGRAMPVRVHAGVGPARVLHLHGGAFGGSVTSGEAVAAALAAAGATVYSAEYPCGADHPFPQAIEAVYALSLELADKRGKHKLFVAGEEAGGNLAAAVALMCRDRLRPKLAGQILLSPMLDPRLGTCSARAAEAGMAGCKWAVGWHNYLRTPDKANHPYAAPAVALRLAGLAPALLVSGPDDPMADETADYAARLRSSGVDVVECRIVDGDAWPDALLSADPSPSWAAPLRQAAAEFYQKCASHSRGKPNDV